MPTQRRKRRRTSKPSATWPKNPEVDHLIGRKLSQKYRFAEGAEYQRKSLAFDPNYRPAKMQLSQDLLRLGEEEEGWRLADEVAKQDAYNVVAFNLVTLQDELAKFRTLGGDGLLVRMDAREADLYGDRVLELLKRARKTLCEKYDVKLDGPIVIEIFPQQKDFAVRTFGMPGVPRVPGRLLRPRDHGQQPGVARRAAGELGSGAVARVLPRRHAAQDAQQDAALAERRHLGLRRAAGESRLGASR